MYIYPDLSLQAMILALEVDAALFPPGMELGLYTNDFVADRNTVLADLDLMTSVEVPGYSVTSPSWQGTPFRKNDGSWEDWTDQNAFIASGGPPPGPVVAFGWFLSDAAGLVLAASGRFPAPFTFSQDGDGFSLKARMNVNQVDGTNVNVLTDFFIE